MLAAREGSAVRVYSLWFQFAGCKKYLLWKTKDEWGVCQWMSASHLTLAPSFSYLVVSTLMTPRKHVTKRRQRPSVWLRRGSQGSLIHNRKVCFTFQEHPLSHQTTPPLQTHRWTWTWWGIPGVCCRRWASWRPQRPTWAGAEGLMLLVACALWHRWHWQSKPHLTVLDIVL